MTIDEGAREAARQLRDHQQQLDMDGVTVGVSRQAIDEVLAELDRLRALLSQERSDGARALLAVPSPSPPTPSPTGTELALEEAKRHIAILTKFWMDSDGWHGASEAARAFIGGVPSPSPDVREMNRGVAAGAAPLPPDRAPALASTADWSRELVKEIAMDIGKDVCAYIEVMYPQAVGSTSSSFLLSLRNSIHNEIMAALDGPIDEQSIRTRLAERKRFRREWKAQWKRIRDMPERDGAGEKAGLLTQAGVIASESPPPSDIREALEWLHARADWDTDVGEIVRTILNMLALTSSPPWDGKLREALEAWRAFDDAPGHHESGEGCELIERARALTRAALSVRDAGEGE